MANQGITRPHLGHRPSVLIVDDDAEMRALLRDVLGREGFEVHEHTSGDGLVPLLADWAPDAIVLDKEMTGPTGLDLLPYIARRHPATPVILVTAFGGSDVEAEALRLGAAYYMDKPFRVARLLEVLRSAARSVGRGDGPADPRDLAREIVREARSRGGLFLFADYEVALRPCAPDRVAVALPLLARGALVALAATPATRVAIISGGDASDLEVQVNVPGVIYAGCRGLFPDADRQKGARAIGILEQWAREVHGQPAVLYLGDAVADEEAYQTLRGRGYAVHVGPLTGESVASCWVVDQAAAIDLLAQIVLAWSVNSSSR
jgi:DNA-binding response OmpR family regulator